MVRRRFPVSHLRDIIVGCRRQKVYPYRKPQSSERLSEHDRRPGWATSLIGGATIHAAIHDVLVLDPESADCLPPQMGLSLWYSGDGTLDDAAGRTKLEKR